MHGNTRHRIVVFRFNLRQAFTLVELLVVIAIIGILVALLLPAVQAAREAARRSQCKNNVKNIALGAMLHVDSHKAFPSGGWGYDWTADPNRGYGPDQPGSWIYNILTYVEEPALRDLGRGQATNSPAFREASEQLHSTAVPLFQCPSRRPSRAYVAAWWIPPPVREQPWIANYAKSSGVGKSDYAANSGDAKEYAGDNLARPASYAEAATLDWSPTHYCDFSDTSREARRNFNHCQTGVMYYRSELKPARILDGTSKTYLVGEKYLHPEAYDCTVTTGIGCTWGDNESMYTGYEWDNHRVAWGPRSEFSVEYYQPRQDTGGFENRGAFGSAHPGSLNMAFCDGSVRSIAYEIDPQTHSRLANRLDGELVQDGAF